MVIWYIYHVEHMKNIANVLLFLANYLIIYLDLKKKSHIRTGFPEG